MPRKKKADAIAEAAAGLFGSERIELDEHLMAGFVETFLQEDFDDPVPSPEFHREVWRLFTSSAPKVVIAAPRGHAKSTAGTFSFGLASALFGTDDFILIVSATESLAAAHLANMARVIEENEDLRTEFGLSILRSNETMLVCHTSFGNRDFCIIGKGAEQKVRGLLWRNKRPSLILVDDLEEDEAVMSKDRREKLRNWFKNALLPCGSKKLRVRFVGTVLHLDSLLERLMADEGWVSRRFRAHRAYDDFDEILWPEAFSVERLLRIRMEYKDNPSGYSQEYLSHPVAEADAFFRKNTFRAMEGDDYKSPKVYYGSIEFAIGKDDKADNTAACVGGMDPENMLHIVHMFAQKIDTLEAVNLMFDLQDEYDIDSWIVEDENISKAIGPFLNQEMRRRNKYLNLVKITPHKDKQKRAVGIKTRMKAGGVKFDMNADWYDAFEEEMMVFPRGKNDDRVDAVSWLGLYLDQLYAAPTQEESEEEEYREMLELTGEDGRSDVTGY